MSSACYFCLLNMLLVRYFTRFFFNFFLTFGGVERIIPFPRQRRKSTGVCK
jgi:hypothetical protein